MAFEAYLEPSDRNDRIVQRSLRAIDARLLVLALQGQPEVIRGIFRRNMSDRAVAFLDEDLRTLQGAVPEEISAARLQLEALLREFTATEG